MPDQSDKQPNGNGETFGQVVDRILGALAVVRDAARAPVIRRTLKRSGVAGVLVGAFLFGSASGTVFDDLPSWKILAARLIGIPTSSALVGANGPTEPAPERRSVLSADGEVDTDDMLEMFDAVDAELAENHAHDYEQDGKINGLQQAAFAHEQRYFEHLDRGLERDRLVMEGILEIKGMLKRGSRGSRSGRNGSHVTPGSSGGTITSPTESDG